MAANGSGSISQPLIPIFKDENYQFWSTKMKTLFKSQDLWDFVESGFWRCRRRDRLRENRKDSKALFFIQQAVHDTIFSRIAAATTSKEAWTILQKELQGSSKVITVKLQLLYWEFKTLFMKVDAIEESKDLSIFSFDELKGYFQAHEARLNRSNEKNEEKAFLVKGESN
ncbi:Retrovirus-related Pol polyprotein from transposon TNT 1-94 [Quillaja saponaria]|uniref:Retrovirus-related Pol polyprotein from transposon TNT 1-94 n=1 Tax=Quillaja saponaria TaxID=32244 RepID=A0AAD7PK23_QUISA|nr:Retrovirus-related Pol polyprotein from transposon TNT 1-94 [Quillaja saponaria]